MKPIHLLTQVCFLFKYELTLSVFSQQGPRETEGPTLRGGRTSPVCGIEHHSIRVINIKRSTGYGFVCIPFLELLLQLGQYLTCYLLQPLSVTAALLHIVGLEKRETGKYSF